MTREETIRSFCIYLHQTHWLGPVVTLRYGDSGSSHPRYLTKILALFPCSRVVTEHATRTHNRRHWARNVIPAVTRPAWEHRASPNIPFAVLVGRGSGLRYCTLWPDPSRLSFQCNHAALTRLAYSIDLCSVIAPYAA